MSTVPDPLAGTARYTNKKMLGLVTYFPVPSFRDMFSMLQQISWVKYVIFCMRIFMDISQINKLRNGFDENVEIRKEIRNTN